MMILLMWYIKGIGGMSVLDMNETHLMYFATQLELVHFRMLPNSYIGEHRIREYVFQPTNAYWLLIKIHIT